MKCDSQLQEQYAIKILLKNIYGTIIFLLKRFTINTFEKLSNKASNFQDKAKQLSFGDQQNGSKLLKVFEKNTISTTDKGK